MNKLSKILLVSSLSILGAVEAIGGVVIAQEPNSEPVEEVILPINKEVPRNQDRPIRYNSNSMNRDVENKVKSPETDRGAINPKIESRSINMENRKENMTSNQEQRAQRISDRCNKIGTKIINHKNTFATKSQGRTIKYNQITTRLENISSKLAEKRVDITTYNSYIQELKAKINIFNQLNQEYRQLLGDIKNMEEFCDDKGQLSDDTEIRKEKLQLIISNDKAIREYIKGTIIPYLRSIKPQAETTSSNSTVSPVASPTNSN